MPDNTDWHKMAVCQMCTIKQSKADGLHM